MSDMDPTLIKEQVAIAAEQGKDLHAMVRDVTLRALSRQRLSASEIIEVVRAVTEGVTLGLDRRAGEIKDAVRDALSGLDEALQKTAEATKLAVQQMLAQGKEFGAQDLKPAIEELQQMEQIFKSTITKVAAAASGRIKEEFSAQLSHARRNGTDSGRVIADTVTDFSQRAAASIRTGAQQTTLASHEIKQRLSLLASGILAGMAQVLQEKAKAGERKAP